MGDPKTDFHRYLQAGRDAILWKLDGLDERDIRRPLTSTGTNLLGLVKHLAGVELGYFSAVFDRPFDVPGPWFGMDAEPNADMYATADESREDIVGLYRRTWALSDATIEALPLDAAGHVPWWTEPRVTLHRVLVHVIAETHRHAGHADIVRELIDGVVGMRNVNDNMASADAAWWADYRNRLEQLARDAAGDAGRPSRDRAMALEDEVLAATAARADALARGDADALRAHLHPLFAWTSHRGDVFDRETYVRRNTDGALRWHGQTLEGVRVVVVSDTAVLHCTAVDRIEVDGRLEIFRVPMTQSWVRSGEGWLCLAGHAGPRIP
jgi:Protein of unknown function (DUF664)/Domain of unknown function (DUF4440)